MQRTLYQRFMLVPCLAFIFAGLLMRISHADPIVSVLTLPFSTAGQAASPVYLATGADGNIWVTESGGSPGERIDRITPAGVISRFWLGTNASARGITSGPDGNLWFCIANPAMQKGGPEHQIGRLNPNSPGTAQTTSTLPAIATYDAFDIPTAGAAPWGIAVGPDGNLWFTEVSGNKIGQITTSGVITEFTLPNAGSQPREIVAGPDGAMWFTQTGGNRIGRITTSGTITEYTLPNAGSGPYGITVGPDNLLWFTEQSGNRIGRLDPANPGTFAAANVTEFAVPTANAQPLDITAGPDGALWFTEFFANKVAQITTAGVITETTVPTRTDAPGFTTGPYGILLGPDNALWFAEQQVSAIGRVDIGPPAPTGPVTNTNDSGAGSLRQAILDANASINLSSISFNIPTSDLNYNAVTQRWTISPTSALPAITAPVIIDATTQPGFVPATPLPVIVLNGTAAGAGSSGFNITGGGSTIRGFIVVNFNQHGILLSNGSGNTVAGNGIGTEGFTDLGNGQAGILISSSGSNTIGGGNLPGDINFISGNHRGIEVTGTTSTNNTIKGNAIGVNLTASAAIANTTYGVVVGGSASSNSIGANGIGNTISGNGIGGIDIGSNSNTVASNKIGTNAAGSSAIPNGGPGVSVDGSSNTIGGLDANERNIISGNNGTGILVGNFSLGGGSGNTIVNNYIGLGNDGSTALGNTGHGIHVVDSHSIIIGGQLTDERNVISSNSMAGISLEAVNATASGFIEGNYIGTDATGLLARGNGEGVYLGLVDPGTVVRNNVVGAGVDNALRDGHGIVVQGPNGGAGVILTAGLVSPLINPNGIEITLNNVGTGADGTTDLGNAGHGILITDSAENTIGDIGLGNKIAFNDGDGVAILDSGSAGINNSIRGNSIHSNSGLGIDLGNNGLTANDTMDVDSGANTLQNFPVVLFANSGSTHTTVTGTLNSTPNSAFTIDVYTNAGGGAQGRTYLGSTTANTNASGNAVWVASVATVTSTGLPITATATNALNNTSEFSTAVNTEPTYSISGLIRTNALHPISGVSVAISPTTGGISSPATTDSNGYYQFTDVPSGFFTLTPAKTNYTFSPASQGISVNHAPRGVNFVGTSIASSSITGRISTSNGTAISGVSVQLNVQGGGPVGNGTLNPVTTNSAGYYTFSNVSNGNYTITPTLAGTTFTPSTQDVTVNNANLTGRNFIGATGFTITGRIVEVDGTGIAGASVTRSGSATPAMTNSAGYYTFTNVPDNATYTLTPTKTGYAFNPVTRSVPVNGANAGNQNFIGTTGFSITGRIATSSGAGIANVGVQIDGGSTVMTNSAGYFTFNNIANGAHTIVPAKAGNTFVPVQRNVTVNNANLTNQNFTGTGP